MELHRLLLKPRLKNQPVREACGGHEDLLFDSGSPTHQRHPKSFAPPNLQAAEHFDKMRVAETDDNRALDTGNIFPQMKFSCDRDLDPVFSYLIGYNLIFRGRSECGDDGDFAVELSPESDCVPAFRLRSTRSTTRVANDKDFIQLPLL